MYRTYYTLRCQNGTKEEIWDEADEYEFDTFEKAYDTMCWIYELSKKDGKQPKYWGIWKTTESEWDNHKHSMIQAVWR